ncbi:MAG TPA: FAD-dependent oxidoreductase [Candidatus Limnocylindrales bacterium]|nr:FAD-dependent oxidoreductase [Candidatus Limnocylindrales bacterium]
MPDRLDLAFGLSFDDLYNRSGLVRLDSEFLTRLESADAGVAARLRAARDNPSSLPAKEESALLLALAPYLDDFVGELFGIQAELAALRQRHLDLVPLFEIKRQFVQRKPVSQVSPAEASAFDGAALTVEIREAVGKDPSDDLHAFELAFARQLTHWLNGAESWAGSIDAATRYAAWALHSKAGRARHKDGVLFHTPKKTDPMHLMHHGVRAEKDGVVSYSIDPEYERHREGFDLTDRGTDLVGALDQANYCIWCHNQQKDSCSKGLREKPAAGEAVGAYKKSAFGVTLAGCPLGEKISEFHTAKVEGHAIGALAIITVDNPTAAATGHRICNDCMKSCIYQKQEPVDIPQAETRTLKDVLELPWGFEIYSLLTKWNPLNIERPLPKEETGRKVLVVGLGPAGFGLSHHLMQDGHTVVAIDGLKIEPLPKEICGVRHDGSRSPFVPIREVDCLYERLGDRVMAGFGGVAEYGITVRWDKNFLKIIRLLLERRAAFSMIGGVRFGSTLTLDEAMRFGFDHVAICIGAGKPTVLDIPNGLARGVRIASDFLMALQLTGAARPESIANMQMQLPVVVVGGGLTAIDTATESLAYYVVQVEKFAQRYEKLVEKSGEASVREWWDASDNAVAEEFLAHAAAIRAERARAKAAGEEPRLSALLKSWGGATIAYRRRLIDSPSYTLNHEEVEKALEEGAIFTECLSPIAIDIDANRSVEAIRFKRQVHSADGRWVAAEGEVRLPARTVFVAAGTQPNTVLAREDEDHFQLDGKYFRACDELGNPVKPAMQLSKPDRADVLLSRLPDGRFVSFFGDVHPSFFGNVVKALGSAKQGYPVVSRVLARRPPNSPETARGFFARMSYEFRPTVERVDRLTPTIIEVMVRAPAAARRFQPGQFYRLQNFETLAPEVGGTKLQMEGLALTGAWVDPDKGLVSTITLEMGGSSSLCSLLREGEPVVLMGPTGAPTHIIERQTAILAGGGLGNAVLFSIGQALRRAGTKVIYFAAYKKAIDRYKVEEIENAADIVIWCSDEAPGFEPTRDGDKTFVGNVVQAMHAYATGALGAAPLSLADASRIIAIGSDRMMAAVAESRHTLLAPYLKPGHCGIGSINSPMQCMMKEICAQCLQPHRDPATGKTTYVFSCFNQDQDLDHVDFAGLRDRLGQNSLSEKITTRWIRHCLEGAEG